MFSLAKIMFLHCILLRPNFLAHPGVKSEGSVFFHRNYFIIITKFIWSETSKMHTVMPFL